MGGIVKQLTHSFSSLLTTESPVSGLLSDAAAKYGVEEPAIKSTSAAAITTHPTAIASRKRSSTSTGPRTRGARSASVLTTDLGDSKLGG